MKINIKLLNAWHKEQFIVNVIKIHFNKNGIMIANLWENFWIEQIEI